MSVDSQPNLTNEEAVEAEEDEEEDQTIENDEADDIVKIDEDSPTRIAAFKAVIQKQKSSSKRNGNIYRSVEIRKVSVRSSSLRSRLLEVTSGQ